MAHDDTALFEEHRGALQALAYRMLGSLADAEDVAQEAWLRWQQQGPQSVDNPRAWLVRVTTRLCLDRLRRIAARRESYVGPWLPEPVATEPDAAAAVEFTESLSMALLVVLETLSPLERAVFVLHEVFAFEYAEIAAMLERTPVAVRQLGHRARGHVQARRPRFDPDLATRRAVTEQFMVACQDADLTGLLSLLAPGVTLVADSGGKVRAPRRPILGAEKVARFLVGALRSPAAPDGMTMHPLTVNDQPGVLVETPVEGVLAVFLPDVVDGRIDTLRLVGNPDKLARLCLGGARS